MELTIQTDSQHDNLYISFSARALEKGVVKRSVPVDENITLDYDAQGVLLGIDLMNASKLVDAGFDDLRIDQLMGVAEAAALFGVQRSNFIRDYANRSDFPKPVVELASGRVWLKAQLEAYSSNRQRRQKRGADGGTRHAFAEALADLEATDELVLLYTALRYSTAIARSQHQVSIEDIIAQSIEEDRRAILLAQQGGPDDYVEAAERLFMKYSPTLTEYIRGFMHDENKTWTIVKSTWATILRDVQLGHRLFGTTSFTRILLETADKRLEETDVQVPRRRTSEDDPLERVVSAGRLQQAQSEDARMHESLRTEDVVLRYLRRTRRLGSAAELRTRLRTVEMLLRDEGEA